MRRAVFCDRDGVITQLAFNPETGAHESPHRLEDLQLCQDAVAALTSLQGAGYELFIVSNQPSYAKGKVELQPILDIAAEVEARLTREGVTFRGAYYCLHHPNGIVSGYSGPCACRKPSPYFLREAAATHDIALDESWMIGDRDSDIQAGLAAGCRTILIETPESLDHQGQSATHCRAGDVMAAASMILAHDGGDSEERGAAVGEGARG